MREILLGPVRGDSAPGEPASSKRLQVLRLVRNIARQERILGRKNVVETREHVVFVRVPYGGGQRLGLAVDDAGCIRPKLQSVENGLSGLRIAGLGHASGGIQIASRNVP